MTSSVLASAGFLLDNIESLTPHTPDPSTFFDVVHNHSVCVYNNNIKYSQRLLQTPREPIY